MQDIVLRHLSIIGEVATAIRSQLEARFPEINWCGMRGFRNYIVHGYFELRWDKVALAIGMLPELIASIEEALDEIAADETDYQSL